MRASAHVGARAFVVGLCSLVVAPGLWAEEPAPDPRAPAIERIGEEHYQIGAIEVDRANNRFTVPGAVIELGSPEDALEFVAVARNSFKDYEALLRLDTDAVGFNLACILIGLEADPSLQPSMHFDPRPIDGQRVAVWVTWTSEGGEERRSAGELLRGDSASPPTEDWVYTGSIFTPDGQFLAQFTGVLISFVHDPDSIIHHRTGLGLGHYGAIRLNPDVVPPGGTPIRLIVERLAE